MGDFDISGLPGIDLDAGIDTSFFQLMGANMQGQLYSLAHGNRSPDFASSEIRDR